MQQYPQANTVGEDLQSPQNSEIHFSNTKHTFTELRKRNSSPYYSLVSNTSYQRNFCHEKKWKIQNPIEVSMSMIS